MGRHVREGRTPELKEVELIVGNCSDSRDIFEQLKDLLYACKVIKRNDFQRTLNLCFVSWKAGEYKPSSAGDLFSASNNFSNINTEPAEMRVLFLDMSHTCLCQNVAICTHLKEKATSPISLAQSLARSSVSCVLPFPSLGFGSRSSGGMRVQQEHPLKREGQEL